MSQAVVLRHYETSRNYGKSRTSRIYESSQNRNTIPIIAIRKWRIIENGGIWLALDEASIKDS
jgi:hypothetical protein